ncbi:MAG: hypothetical protein ACHQRJ_22720 [Alphaproteobacteria bacterium]
MDPFYQYLSVKCAKCGDDLIRVAQSEADDRVICPTCFAVGDYKRVIKESAGLTTSVLVSEDTKKFVEQLRARRTMML